MSSAINETWNLRFKASPFRLRYELGGEEFDNIAAPVPRLMQALTRARSIREASFAESKQLWAVIRSWGTDGFEALSQIGFRGSLIAEWQEVEKMPDNSVEQAIWRAFDVTGDEVSCDILLWSSIVYEMPIEPRAPVDSYLVDMERGILLHVYDDRGMDVTALSALPLNEVRRRFDSWILPHDRTRIEAAFSL